ARGVAAAPVRAGPPACSASRRGQPLVRPEAREIAAVRVGDDHDVSAFAAVPSVGAAARDVLLPPEVDRTVTTTARNGRQLRAIVEHQKKRKVAGWPTRSR